MSVAETHVPAVAVVLGAIPGHQAAMQRTLEAAGHRVRQVASAGELAAIVSSEPVALVVLDGAQLQARAGLPVLAAVASARPGAHVVAVHDVDDVRGMWRSFRRGAIPWAVDEEPTLPTLTRAGSSRDVALHALHQELTGEHAAACQTLATIRDPRAATAVVDALTGAGSAALERLRNRSRYPVPTELLVDHLPEHVGTLEGREFSAWWSMVQAIAFRASGLRLPIPELELEERPLTVVFGGFHAASTIVRFTARRQWRRPADLLADLAPVS